MALDDMLLDQAIAARAPQACLRLYSWSGPWLSVGYHQRHLPASWLALAEQGQIGLVRRPSGGRAVLHGGSLTYALIQPNPAADRRQAYRDHCRWLQRAFAEMGLPLSFGTARAAAESGNCFARASAADLVHSNGAKRIGSAQLWRRGVLLQHGSLLLRDNATVGGPARHAAVADLVGGLAVPDEAVLSRAWGRWIAGQLGAMLHEEDSPFLRGREAEVAAHASRFREEWWTARR
jgi:lipoate-protein ligase A